MKSIDTIRKEIDILDDQIMSLLEERYNKTNEIGRLKQQENIVILDVNRENYIINKISKYSHSPQIESIYRAIMKESRKAQKKE